ncbi:unnamed protein product [Gordionus sp. m RMFG-2023]
MANYYHSSPNIELTYLALELCLDSTLIDIKDGISTLKQMNLWLTNRSRIVVNIMNYKYFDRSNVFDAHQTEAYLNNLLEIDFEKSKQSPYSKHIIVEDSDLNQLPAGREIVVILITNIPQNKRKNFYSIAKEYPNKKIVAFNFFVREEADPGNHHKGAYLYPTFSQLNEHITEIRNLHRKPTF